MEESTYINNILNRISNDIFTDFNKSSNIAEKIDKDNIITKITKNISIIKNLYDNNIINESEKKNILSNLNKIYFNDNKNNATNATNATNTNNNLKQYKKIKKELGYIIFDIYHYSEYHVLMSNIPSKIVLNIDNNKKYNIDEIDETDDLEIINSESIYDTIHHYIGNNTVENIFQVSENNYLVKMKNIYDSKKLCDTLNKMQIGNNIIKVELLNPLPIIVEQNINDPVIVEKIIIEQADSDSTNLSVSNSSDSIKSEIVTSDSVKSEIVTSEIVTSEEILPNITSSIINLDKQDVDIIENNIYISSEISCEISKENLEKETLQTSSESSITGSIFNKISNFFSFFKKN